MAENVRYFLEQTVPELEDLERKNVFSKTEINKIMRRRTEFEHRIAGRASKSADFIKYIQYEMNLDNLRRKRIERLSPTGIVDMSQSVSDWSGQRKILFIFERAVRKFYGDLQLWSLYLQYAKELGSINVVEKIYSKMIQLHPTDTDLWISAAKFEFEENANAKNARTLLQRALRFNSEQEKMWLNYFVFELSYVSKLLLRRRILGLNSATQQIEQQELDRIEKEDEQRQINEKIQANEDIFTDNFQSLSTVKLNNLPETDINMLGAPDSNPALKGDVALAVFRIAVDTLTKTRRGFKGYSLSLVKKFISIVDGFEVLDREYLVSSIVTHMSSLEPTCSEYIVIVLTLPLRYLSISSPELPVKLQLSVNNYLKLDEPSIKNEYVEFLTKLLEESRNEKNDRIAILLQHLVKKCKYSI
ncbi:BA75_02365T0 [Komagataella pastoris]|uniref:BA75_02365T0 n=1 Tax=Komagataella pastoris TaxID=4922 RepID=A0A1B2JB61_PICPA|nr:BA75_02365T0 [Komagataella pastoris]